MPLDTEQLKQFTNDKAGWIIQRNFTEEFAKNFIDKGKFYIFKPMTIAGRSGFLIVFFEIITEKWKWNIKQIIVFHIFHDKTHLHFINCGVGTGNIEEDLPW
jgi:hypothetical protein